MYLFVVFYLLEATIRKYAFPSPLIILLKYLPLYISLYVNSPKKLSYLFYILLGIPLWATITDSSQLPFAFFDFNATILVPLACLLVIPSVSISKRVATGIISLGLIGGAANSGLIIVQALLGPTHWISQTVDQQFTQHVFGWGGLLQKAPGIAAQSSPFITVAGLVALFALSRQGHANRNFSLSFKALVIISVLFNLNSRNYSLGVLLYLGIEYILPLLSSRLVLRSLYAGIFFAVVAYVLYSTFLYYFPGFAQSNRTVEDFGSAWGRISSFYPVEQFFYSLPLLGEWGLGSTVNNNPMFVNIASTPIQCLGVLGEWEFTRLVCAFGWYGYLLIAARVAAAMLLLRRSVLSLLKTTSRSPESLAFIYVAINTLLGAQFKTNDIASGLLLICIVGRATSFMVDPRPILRLTKCVDNHQAACHSAQLPS